MESVLREFARSALSFQAVVAFATKAGVEAALPHIRKIAERGHASITVGLYQGITEPSALRALAKAKKAMNGRLDVRISRVPNLHRKVYVFGLAKQAALLVGSSNLSIEGLYSEGEFNILIRLPSAREILRYLPELADRNDATLPLTPQLISEYERSRNRPQSGITRSKLHSLVRVRPRSLKVAASSARETSWFRHGLVGLVRASTKEVVAQQTDWDRRGWEWCTVDREDRVSIGDYVLLFEYLGKQAWVRVVQVKGITRTAVPTPDGRFFFAYREDRRHFKKKRMGQGLLVALAAAGWSLTKRESRDTRRLSRTAVSVAKQIFSR